MVVKPPLERPKPCLAVPLLRPLSDGGRLRRVDDFALDIPTAPETFLLEAPAADENPENLLFLSGAAETKPVQEVVIDGRFHGALSYAFGKALQGMRSDLDSDGAISRDELGRYLTRVAQGLNDGRSLPSVVAKLGPDFAVLQPDPAAKTFSIAMPARLEGVDKLVSREVGELALTHRPDLSWNQQSGDITDSTGETVATAVSTARLPEVEAKFELLGLAREALGQQSFDIALHQDGALAPEAMYLEDRFDIKVGPVPYPHLTIFNLANNGEVQLICPVTPEERKPKALGAQFSFEAFVNLPLGIDHVVAIASKQAPTTLRKQLNWNMTADAMVPSLERLSVQDNVAFGIVSMSTRKR